MRQHLSTHPEQTWRGCCPSCSNRCHGRSTAAVGAAQLKTPMAMSASGPNQASQTEHVKPGSELGSENGRGMHNSGAAARKIEKKKALTYHRWDFLDSAYHTLAFERKGAWVLKLSKHRVNVLSGHCHAVVLRTPIFKVSSVPGCWHEPSRFH